MPTMTEPDPVSASSTAATGTNTDPLVEMVGLSKRYGEFDAVKDISLSVSPGEIVALLGRGPGLLSLWPAALASAALFAIVHPPFAAPPVFVLGALAALSFELSGLLIAPMAAHAVYNAVVMLAPR